MAIGSETSADGADLVTYAARYVGLQAELIEALTRETAATFRGFPGGWPLNGALLVNGRSWTYARHGAGYRFERDDGATVEAHEYIDSTPRLIDAFRLSEYLSSIGINAVSYRLRTYSVDVLGLEDALSRLCFDGILVIDERTSGRPVHSYTFP